MKRLAASSILLIAACTTGSTGPYDLTQRCTNEAAGYSVSYPASWSTNDGSVVASCTAFDEEVPQIPAGSEMPFDLPVVLSVEQVSARELTVTTRWERVESARSTQIAGRPAFRIESVATGEGLASKGLRSTRYAIDLGQGRSLIASTHAAEGVRYDRNRQVLEGMVRSLSFHR